MVAAPAPPAKSGGGGMLVLALLGLLAILGAGAGVFAIVFFAGDDPLALLAEYADEVALPPRD